MQKARLGLEKSGVAALTLALGDGDSTGRALDAAVNGLARTKPEYSAATPHRALGPKFAVAGSFLAAAGLGLLPGWLGDWTAVVLSLPFAAIVSIRSMSLYWLLASPAAETWSLQSLPDADLPRYTIIVPLYKEAAVVPALIDALVQLDYPEDRVQVLIVTEFDDAETRSVLARCVLGPSMRVLTVPPGAPKTKPRALNFALQFATGKLVAIFDAEDIPEPGQLRQAAARFAVESEDVACLQARLNIYNPGASTLTRQFTLEYAVLFDAILPALERLGLAIPLGGTSNHFRRESLIEAGAWDPYNVTEDADLGFRLARLGKRAAMLSSTTWEEAPETLAVWFGQRTRWLKGWMQTYLVHMRDPGRLWRDLGAWKFFGFHLTLGGMVLSALVHPWAYAIVAGQVWLGAADRPPLSTAGEVCLAIVALGYLSGIALAVAAVRGRKGALLAKSALLIPVYWLAISAAAYAALRELILKPSHWQKTPHSARPVAPLHFPANGSRLI